MRSASLRPLSLILTLLFIWAMMAAVSGCESIPVKRHDRVLTQAEHDSILATETAIPGTVVVARALDAKERNAQKTAALNAQIDSLTR
ncbi:MAG TPA: hypothetical protein VF720_03115 [Candidatus Eisenbacteria bacterium]